MTQADSTVRAVTLVSGAPRGLGPAMARQLLERGQRVLALQRNPAAGLQDGDNRLEQRSCDLAEPAAVAARLGGVCSVSSAPGIVNTGMPRELRAADPTVFAAQPMVGAMKEQGRPETPESCARKLVACLERPDFGSRPVAGIRDLA